MKFLKEILPTKYVSWNFVGGQYVKGDKEVGLIFFEVMIPNKNTGAFAHNLIQVTFKK